MPLYEYQCESCEHRFEKIQKYTDPAPDACPKCGGPVRKLASSPAIQFKGSGWYITDYAKKSGTEGGKSAGGKSETSTSTSGNGSEASSTGSKAASNTSDASAKPDTAAAKSDAPTTTKSS